MMLLCETEITGLSETVARAKLVFPIVLEWRNWQTQQTQNLPPVTRRGGSTPPSSTKLFCLESVRYQPLFSCVPCTCPRLLPRAPRLAHIRLQLLLSRTDPRGVMSLRNSHTLVPEQNGNTVEGHTRQQQLHREGIAKSMRVAVRYLSQREEPMQWAPPYAAG